METFMTKRDGVLRLFKMSIVEARRDFARVTMPLEDEFRNGMGVAHGGSIFSLADIAFGAAANCGRENCVVSLNATIEYLRPGKTGPLSAEAHIVRDGKHVVNYEVKIYDGEGQLIARSMACGYVTNIPQQTD